MWRSRAYVPHVRPSSLAVEPARHGNPDSVFAGVLGIKNRFGELDLTWLQSVAVSGDMVSNLIGEQGVLGARALVDLRQVVSCGMTSTLTGGDFCTRWRLLLVLVGCISLPLFFPQNKIERAGLVGWICMIA